LLKLYLWEDLPEYQKYNNLSEITSMEKYAEIILNDFIFYIHYLVVYTLNVFYPVMVFSPLFNWFQLFIYGKKNPKVAGHGQNREKMDLFKGGCRWLQLVSIDFKLFYFF
jgi:hypothetical protein